MSTRGAATGGPVAEDRFATLAVALGVAAAIELVVLRSFTRTAIHIPALEQLAAPYRAITWFGRFDYYVAVILLAVALPASVVALGRRSPRAGMAAGVAIGLFAAAAAFARLGLAGDTLTGWLAIASVVAMALVFAARSPRRAVVLAIYAAAFALAGTSVFADTRHAGTQLWSAEVLAVAAGVLAPAAFRVGVTRGTVAAGILAGSFAFALLVGSGPTTRILLLWNEGMTGALPAAAYAAAAAALAATLLALARRGELLAATGLLLVVMGGVGLHNTYQTGLAVIGLAVLAVAAQPAALAASRPILVSRRPIAVAAPAPGP